MTDFKLGDKVRFTRHLVRTFGKDHARGYTSYTREGEGVVVGTRTLYNGHAVLGGWEEPTVFVPEESFQAVLVAFHLRKAPIYVPTTAVVKIDG
jgi:hypothetical protein